jgi:hypothetical protein
MDLHHVDAVDAPPHDLVRTTGENLEFNKKVSTMGDWYSYMPWGAPKQLKQNIALVREMIDAVVERVKNDGEAGDLRSMRSHLRHGASLTTLSEPPIRMERGYLRSIEAMPWW